MFVTHDDCMFVIRPVLTEELDELRVKVSHKETIIQKLKLQFVELNNCKLVFLSQHVVIYL